MGFKELITNDNGRLSTTAFIQFFCNIDGNYFGLLRLFRPSQCSGIIYGFALFCGGGVATKGFANAIKSNKGE